MGSSGYVNWHKLDRTLPWIRYNERHTYVYAFWLVDYGHNSRDAGVGLLKDANRHPDWFVHAETADHVLAAYTSPKTWISPNFTTVFDNSLASRPLLGSLLIGSVDAHYGYFNGKERRIWWCSHDDLTFWGRQVMQQLDGLYERPSVLVTFVDSATDENHGPRDPRC